jgi:hypothetical protein
VGAAARAAAVVTIMGLVLTGAAPAAAQDRSLSQDFPLRLEDAFPTATGEGTMRVSVRGVLLHRGADRVEAPVTLELGVASRTQLSISAGLSSEPHETRAGDVQVAGRYQFWVQEAVLPNLAAQLAVTAPTGVDAQAWTLEAKGLATRAVSTTLFVHFNAAAAVVGSPRRRRAPAALPAGAGPVVDRATLGDADAGGRRVRGAGRATAGRDDGRTRGRLSPPHHRPPQLAWRRGHRGGGSGGAGGAHGDDRTLVRLQPARPLTARRRAGRATSTGRR